MLDVSISSGITAAFPAAFMLMQKESIDIDIIEKAHHRFFQYVARKVSFTFAVVLISSVWIWISACYAVYFVYSTVVLSPSEMYAGIRFLFFSIVTVLVLHMIHFGAFHRLGFSGFSQSIRVINHFADGDFFFTTHNFLERDEIREFYNAILNLPRRNFITSSGYALLVVIGMILFHQIYVDPSLHPDDIYVVGFTFLGGFFSTLIYGYLVYNFTEYIIGPYKERVERIVFNDRIEQVDRYLLSFRYKALFTLVMIILSMIVLTIFVWASEKPVLTVILFILLSILAISFLLFIVVNNFNIELDRVTKSARNLAAGGDGMYYPFFLNREIMNFSFHYNKAAIEIRDIRRDLDYKVNEKTEELRNAYDKLNTLYRQSQSDLILAKRIQEGILSRQFEQVKSLDVFIRYYPMKEVGGDLYDIQEIRPGLMRFFLADAEGHGVQAALVTMIIKAEYEKFRFSENPAVLLDRLNESYVRLYEHLDVFFSCIIIDIDEEKSVLSYASAGHPCQILIHDGKLVKLQHTGKLVGIVQGTTYRFLEHPYSRKDRLVLFTDGLFEEFNEDEEEFGEERLWDFLENHKNMELQVMLKSLIKNIKYYLGNPEKVSLHDDITLIGIEFKTGR